METHNRNSPLPLVYFGGRNWQMYLLSRWLRSSVVSVLFSVKTENVPTGYIFFTCIFPLGRWSS